MTKPVAIILFLLLLSVALGGVFSYTKRNARQLAAEKERVEEQLRAEQPERSRALQETKAEALRMAEETARRREAEKAEEDLRREERHRKFEEARQRTEEEAKRTSREIARLEEELKKFQEERHLAGEDSKRALDALRIGAEEAYTALTESDEKNREVEEEAARRAALQRQQATPRIHDGIYEENDKKEEGRDD